MSGFSHHEDFVELIKILGMAIAATVAAMVTVVGMCWAIGAGIGAFAGGVIWSFCGITGLC